MIGSIIGMLQELRPVLVLCEVVGGAWEHMVSSWHLRNIVGTAQ